MPAIKHVHTYIKYKKRPGYFRCAAPDCTHCMDKEVLEGKHSLCNVCGNLFTLTKKDLMLSKPRCLNCSNTKKAKMLRKAQELTRGLGTEAFGEILAGSLTEPLDFFDKPIDYSSFGLNSEDDEKEPEELA